MSCDSPGEFLNPHFTVSATLNSVSYDEFSIINDPNVSLGTYSCAVKAEAADPSFIFSATSNSFTFEIIEYDIQELPTFNSVPYTNNQVFDVDINSSQVTETYLFKVAL